MCSGVEEQRDQLSMLQIGLADLLASCEVENCNRFEAIKGIIKDLTAALLNRSLDKSISLSLLLIVEELCGWKVNLVTSKRLQSQYEKQGMEGKRPGFKMPEFVDVSYKC